MRTIACCGVALLLFVALHARANEALLAVGQGQIPSDTGSDGKTTFAIEDHEKLGGKALKVVFASGDSMGDRVPRVRNWKPFTAIEFAAFNPANENVSLTFVVRHKGTTNFQTRVDAPITLKPGKNQVSLPLASLKNNNGSPPDLESIGRWYLAAEEGKAPTIWLGDIWLAGADGGRAPGAAARAVETDPARLERIRASKMPPITKPVLFNTPEADAIVSALEIFPADNPWNQLVTKWPLHPNSKNMIASVGATKPLRYNPDMNYVLIPADQKRIDVKLVGYPDESDKGPYPVPENVPIEGWPMDKLSLEDSQRDKNNTNADRHAIVVDPTNRMLYEFYQMKRTDAGWQAAQASIFDLKSNKLRPTGWTSTDAAGLPIFPAVVRYDELKRGVVDHALRVTIRKSRRDFVPPATHFASRLTDENLPRMGERIRLRQDFDVSGFSPEVKIILTALKRYGMLVADNGIEWAISVAPDERIPNLHEELRKVKGSDFEVVVPPQ